MDSFFNNFDLNLHELDPQVVIEKIRHFRSLNIRALSDGELEEAIFEALSVNNRAMFMASIRTLPEGTAFFRVRKLKSSVISDSGFCEKGAFWEPPADIVVNPARLNKAHESLLYVSIEDPQATINECRISNGDFYALIKYVAIKPININIIGGRHDYQKMGITDKKAIMIYDMYNDFLVDEFSRDVGKGTEFLYRTSEMIAKAYFDLPPEVQDAWVYASVLNKQMFNACFRPEKAHSLLSLQGALICKQEDGLVSPRAFAVPRTQEMDSVPAFFTVTEDIMDKIFPQLRKQKGS